MGHAVMLGSLLFVLSACAENGFEASVASREESPNKKSGVAKGDREGDELDEAQYGADGKQIDDSLDGEDASGLEELSGEHVDKENISTEDRVHRGAIDACARMVADMNKKKAVVFKGMSSQDVVSAFLMGQSVIPDEEKSFIRVGFVAGDSAAEETQNFFVSAIKSSRKLSKRPTFSVGSIDLKSASKSLLDLPLWFKQISAAPFDPLSVPAKSALGLEGVDVAQYCSLADISTPAHLQLQQYIDCDGKRSKSVLVDYDEKGREVSKAMLEGSLPAAVIVKACGQ